MRTRFLLFPVLLLLISGLTLAQLTFTDGYFTVPVPRGWTNQSEGTLAHFVSSDREMHIYMHSMRTTSEVAAKTALLAKVTNNSFNGKLVENDFSALQSLTWKPDYYTVDGEIWMISSNVREDRTYVFLLQSASFDLLAALEAMNTVLIGITFNENQPVVERPDYFKQNSFAERQITLVNGIYELPATLTVPLFAKAVPAVLLLNGSGSNNRDEQLGDNRPIRDIAWGLASQGIAVLRFDERTFVYPTIADRANFTIDAEITDDALAGIDLLRKTAGVDPTRIYVVGHSRSALVAPRIGERDSELAGLVLISGNARNFEDVLAEQIEVLRLEGTPADQLATGQSMVVWLTALRRGNEAWIKVIPQNQRAYLASIVEYDHLATAQGLTMPMLFLRGERDPTVTMEDFALWQETLADRDNVTFISYPGLNYWMMATRTFFEPGYVDGEVITDIVEWIAP